MTWAVPLSADLVEEFSRRVADSLEPSGLHHGQVRIGDVPEVRRDLVARDEVFDLRATNPGPPFDIAELEVEDVGDLRREVFDVGIPVEIVGSAEQELRVVIQNHEAHVVNSANHIHHFIANAAVKNLQKSAQPPGSAWCERSDHRQLRHLALPAADPTGGATRPLFCSFPRAGCFGAYLFLPLPFFIPFTPCYLLMHHPHLTLS